MSSRDKKLHRHLVLDTDPKYGKYGGWSVAIFRFPVIAELLWRFGFRNLRLRLIQDMRPATQADMPTGWDLIELAA